MQKIGLYTGFVFLLISQSLSAQTQVVTIDMTNYQSGFFAVKLIESAAPNDTLVVNTCGGVICNYPKLNGTIRVKFSLFIRVDGKLVEVPDIFETKRVKRKKLYDSNGFYISRNGQPYLIMKIGNKKVLSEKVEIDGAIMSKAITKNLSCW
jgi:hypothetical protein